ncbi:ABC transporter ATP-binding protein [Deinococcus peraridilitoris]|uniref:ABC-type proline/glycine betaine transport system, ATPase component n=1 Tax=Deinococcus peraridilitoris (strain DSM 19664 / LMG 22246 / CIP 109416 / KR-200) TaxID=937777 RepID=L0A763_DEIPD|nr:ABC transporter ATP-binding protein [Deinococcus peraridilitoris]AFZ69698.1 ABC-type proline/glycine betaine transport system, ATPase component [Deinococcus peraridilitoris DSM 19664]
MTSIELHQLDKQYGSVYAVRDLTLHFPEGRITALLGPSGCGKTTTLRMINRLVEPTGGRVLLGGRDTRELKGEELRRNMGYVIQQVGLFPHYSVAQNIATVPQLLGWDRARITRRVDELLDLVGLPPDEFRLKRPAQLSGGQAQRVGVARALAADPPVLLMDEPFGALDPIARERVQDEFLAIQRQLHKTVVLVTHDLDEALRLGDYIALMHAGQLAQFGTPDELVLTPGSPFVERFLGDDAHIRRLARKTVRDLMSHERASTAGPGIDVNTNARTALAWMLREGVAELRVMEGERTVGRLTLRDLGGA